MVMSALSKRFINNCYDYDTNCSDSWENWVRWLVLGLIIAAALLIFFFFSCFTARRRRNRGMTPYYGTGWTTGFTPYGHGPATYYHGGQTSGTTNGAANDVQPPYYGQNSYGGPNGANNDNSVPPYSPPANGYYGGRDGDVELQQPQGAYHPNSQVYAPPPGSPPAKK